MDLTALLMTPMFFLIKRSCLALCLITLVAWVTLAMCYPSRVSYGGGGENWDPPPQEFAKILEKSVQIVNDDKYPPHISALC